MNYISRQQRDTARINHKSHGSVIQSMPILLSPPTVSFVLIIFPRLLSPLFFFNKPLLSSLHSLSHIVLDCFHVTKRIRKMFYEQLLFYSGGGASSGGINVPSVARLGSINTRYQRGYSSVSSSCSSRRRLQTSSCSTMGRL